MSKGWIIFWIVMAVLAVVIVVLYFLGKKAQKKQAEQQEQIDANKQIVSMFIISKKMMKLKEAGLPQQIADSVPKLMRRSKLPIIRAKVGPQLINFVCDSAIFDKVPVKKEVKATVSGIYVTDVKGLHGKQTQQVTEKKGIFKRAMAMVKAKTDANTKPVK